MWEKNEIDIDTIKVGEIKKITFVYNGRKIISRFVPGCGCTSIRLKDNILSVTLNIKEFPRHLNHQQEIGIKKNIAIYYKGVIRPEILYIAGKLTQR